MKIAVEIEAEQWTGEHGILPKGAHFCVPEVHWSADRKLVYFTYADLHVRHWISADASPMPATGNPPFMGSRVASTKQDGTEVWRDVYPFMAWSIKSEASVKRDHRAVYIDRDDARQMEAFADFRFVEQWPNPLPPRAEYRITDGSYGRGFKPIYLKPGDWLVKEPGREPRAMSEAEFQQLRA